MNQVKFISIMMPAVLALTVLLGSGVACYSTPRDITVVSSTDSGHNHTIVVWGLDLETPPLQKLITTSAAGAIPHTHQIMLTKQQLVAIASGEAVTVVSTPLPANNHTHKFLIKR